MMPRILLSKKVKAPFRITPTNPTGDWNTQQKEISLSVAGYKPTQFLIIRPPARRNAWLWALQSGRV